jgi:NAD(P)-dependent dehydrogenase (short-subunit alcohol dehydrogenase family)
MELKDRIVVITGAASGIGRALAVRFAAEGAKLIVCADRDEKGVKETAERVGGVAFVTDVSREADIQSLIETVEATTGPSTSSAPTPGSASAAAPRRPTTPGSGSGTSTSWPTSGRRGTWSRGWRRAAAATC